MTFFKKYRGGGENHPPPSRNRVNIAKAKKMNDSPSSKILDPKTGKKFEESIHLREHVHKHFQNIFKFKQQSNTNIESFLKNAKDSQNNLKKKLTDDEKKNMIKKSQKKNLNNHWKVQTQGRPLGRTELKRPF